MSGRLTVLLCLIGLFALGCSEDNISSSELEVPERSEDPRRTDSVHGHDIHSYYFDLEIGELIKAPSGSLPPIILNSGHEAVRAYVFTCGDCNKKEERFLGWLEKYTPAAKEILESPPLDDEDGVETFEKLKKGHFISTNGKNWVGDDTSAGFKIQRRALTKCGPNTVPTPCYPTESASLKRIPNSRKPTGGYYPRIRDVYFYDVGTGELLLASSHEIPPVTSPNGNEAVRAYVSACGDCSLSSKRFIAWLEKYSPAAKKALAGPASEDASYEDTFKVMEEGHLISVDGKTWAKANSQKGIEIMESMEDKCESNEVPKLCNPGE